MAECINCKSLSSKFKYDVTDIFGDTFKFVQCLNCKVYFLNPRPTSSQLSKAYAEDYYGYGDKKFNGLIESLLLWFKSRNAKKISSFIPESASVLDVGCGNGSFLKSLHKNGNFKLFGIEPQGKSAERASNIKEVNLHVGYLEKGLYDNSQFDFISLIHVFEHLANPSEVLEIITEISKEKGILLIEIPNINSWQAKIFKESWLHLDPPRHLNMFPPKVLESQLQNLGWQLEKETFIAPQYSPFGVQQSILNVFLNKRDVLYEFLKGNKAYVEDYSKLSLFLMQVFQWLSFPLFVLTDVIASLCKKGGTVKMYFKKTA